MASLSFALDAAGERSHCRDRRSCFLWLLGISQRPGARSFPAPPPGSPPATIRTSSEFAGCPEEPALFLIAAHRTKQRRSPRRERRTASQTFRATGAESAFAIWRTSQSIRNRWMVPEVVARSSIRPTAESLT